MNKGETDPARSRKRAALRLRQLLIISALSAAILTGAMAATNADGKQLVSSAPGGIAAMQSAAAAKRYLFIFFYSNTGNSGLVGGIFGGHSRAEQSDAMKAVFDAAEKQAGDRADSVAVNIKDPRESEIVKRFDVARSPMPAALVVAPNGAITGGFPGKFTQEQLVGAMTTPAMEKCLKTLQDRKLVFLCIQNSKTRSNDEAMRGVRDFKDDIKYGSATEVVMLDPSDKAESKVLSQFQINPATKDAMTVFLAPPGVPIGTFTGATDKKTLVAKLTASVASCGSGCGPNGCGPAK